MNDAKQRSVTETGKTGMTERIGMLPVAMSVAGILHGVLAVNVTLTTVTLTTELVNVPRA